MHSLKYTENIPRIMIEKPRSLEWSKMVSNKRNQRWTPNPWGLNLLFVVMTNIEMKLDGFMALHSTYCALVDKKRGKETLYYLGWKNSL